MEICLIVIITIIGIVCAQAMFPGELDISKYILMNVGTLLVQLLIAGICFLSACIFDETKWYLTCGVGIPLIFYIIQMIANMGGDLEKFKYVTIFTLVPYNKIIAGSNGILPSMFLMAGITLILFGTGTVIFNRKDLHI